MNKHLNQSSKDQKLEHLDYLEIVEGAEALEFARKNNGISDARIKSDKRFQTTFDEILKIVTAKDKLPAFYLMHDEIYNFWQDNVHIKGILRKTSVKAFNSGAPTWETVLDIDQISKSEQENWVYKGINCLEPSFEICILQLSRGGKDAVVLREYNLKERQFVVGGFAITESKSAIAWLDQNTILVGDATNPATLTASGYPSEIKVLKRGERLSDAKVIFSCGPTCMSAGVSSQYNNGKRYAFATNQISFFEAQEYRLDLQSLKAIPIPIPKTANFVALFKEKILFTNREPLKDFKAGSLLSISVDARSLEVSKVDVVFSPSESSFYEYLMASKDHLWVVTLNEVKKRIIKYSLSSGRWVAESLSALNENGNTGMSAADSNSSHIYLNYSDFLTPTTIYYMNEYSNNPPHTVLKAPAFFKSDGYKISQFKAKSKDGTLVPYFIVHAKNIKYDGQNPTLLYGYGGFEISMTSSYLGSTGKVWLEKGGVYALSNIRGGGEYGPLWHQAALRENRHKAYEDFYAIAEDLISRKITTPRHLGIRGGSNGGLLTSVSFVQRPELFNAVISEVPLANMLEYHKWLAGASWMEEYGDPENQKMREYLLTYSPLHNLSKDAKYPEVFYLTSTKDDRVHPGHARQMVARLQELGHPVLYNENTDGGHGRASNMKDLAEFLALEFTYLYQKLF